LRFLKLPHLWLWHFQDHILPNQTVLDFKVFVILDGNRLVSGHCCECHNYRTYSCTSRLLKMFNSSQTQYERHHMYLLVAADGNSEFCLCRFRACIKVKACLLYQTRTHILYQNNVKVFSLVIQANYVFSWRLYDRKGGITLIIRLHPTAIFCKKISKHLPQWHIYELWSLCQDKKNSKILCSHSSKVKGILRGITCI
jgi:hypothetical protein